jgi:Carboxypeptidase regulatory-like domain
MSLGLFGLLLFGAMQKGAAQQPATKPADLCVVEGTVLAADTGQPLRKAWVSGSSAASPIGVVTDAAGHFILKDVPPGRYHLSAVHTGYLRQQLGQKDPNARGTILSLAPGQHVRDISFRLIRAAAISGHIYDEDGEPVQNADVKASRYLYFEGKRGLAPVADARTNDLGEFRLFGLAPGQYYVSADYNRELDDMGGGHSYAPVYYPSAMDLIDASPLALRAGDDYPGVDINLQTTRSVSISGRVFNAVTGQPAAGADILLSPHGGKEFGRFSVRFRTSVQDPEGNFKIDAVTPGSYYLFALINTEGSQIATRQAIEVGDADVTGVNLVISPGITIKGRVTVEGKSDVSGVQLGLRPRETQMFFSSTMTNPRRDGTFVLNNVPDGSYEVTAWGLPEDAYLKSARLGDSEALLSGVEINGGQAAGPLEIVVGANGGRLNGAVVRDDKPLTGATVALVPKDAAMRADTRWQKATTTDQYGAFTLRGIRPGDYQIFAWEKIEPNAYQDPAFLKRFEKGAESVEIKEGQQRTVRLTALENESQ